MKTLNDVIELAASLDGKTGNSPDEKALMNAYIAQRTQLAINHPELQKTLYNDVYNSLKNFKKTFSDDNGVVDITIIKKMTSAINASLEP
ncbi:MAG: hypothetical protein JW841_09090 [Deltaproteobacteria bacterium]|nr:hypothetical protein [Deltaproteobacteria bacterium]